MENDDDGLKEEGATENQCSNKKKGNFQATDNNVGLTVSWSSDSKMVPWSNAEDNKSKPSNQAMRNCQKNFKNWNKKMPMIF